MTISLEEAVAEIERGGCYCTACLRPIEGDNGDSVVFFYFGLCGECVGVEAQQKEPSP